MMKNKNSEPLKKELKTTTELIEISKSQSKSSSKEKINLWNAPNVVDFACEKLNITLDPHQKEYVEAEGNSAAHCGRQSGKSFSQAIRTAIFCLLWKKEDHTGANTVLITGGVERQAYELYIKVREVIKQIAPHMIVGRPTMERTELKNGLRILSLPCGRDGMGLRTYALVRLVVDEAHYVHDDVYTAIEPMLATTGGTMDLLSTPRGNKGRFFEACQPESGFKVFHWTSEDCPRITKEFLGAQRKRMTKLQYAQEYLAIFISDLQQFYPDEIVNACLADAPIGKRGSFFLGVDVARYGGDENAFVVVERVRNHVRVVRIETTERVSTWETMKRIQSLNAEFKFRKIYIDDGGIGGAVLDALLQDAKIKFKIVGLNNAQRSIIGDKSKGKRILKEDMHGNLRRLLEQKLIYLPKHDAMLNSLSSVQFEYTDHRNFKIYGKYTHITEAMVRACWCMIEKPLNIYCA